MAVGDIVNGLAQVADNAYLICAAASGDEIVIHNIYHEDDIEIEWSDATNSITFDTVTGAGAYAYFAFHCEASTGQFIRVKNVAGAAKYIGFDAIKTKD